MSTPFHKSFSKGLSICTHATPVRTTCARRTFKALDLNTGELTHIDLWGKYDVTSIHGNSYYLLMVDDASRYITVEFLKAKSEAADKIKEYFAYLMARGKTPCALRMDRGTEFVNEDLQTWCNSQGIKFQLTTPYSPS